MNTQEDNAIKMTKKWISEFIIAYTICPFAERSFASERIMYNVSISSDHFEMAFDFVQYMRNLIFMEAGFSNAFIIFPERRNDFTWFYEFSLLCEDILKEMKWDNVYQLVAFHPFYLFGKEKKEARSHYTNRSPFPMLHILKVQEVELAIKSIGDTSAISHRNALLLNEMKREEFQKLLDLIYTKKNTSN